MASIPHGDGSHGRCPNCGRSPRCAACRLPGRVELVAARILVWMHKHNVELTEPVEVFFEFSSGKRIDIRVEACTAKTIPAEEIARLRAWVAASRNGTNGVHRKGKG